MKPWMHLLYGMLAVISIGRIFGTVPSILFLLATVFIDVDHYIFYVYKTGNFNLRKAYGFHLTRGKKSGTYKGMFFHTLEFVITMAVLSYFIPYVLFIFFGVIFHLSLDFVSHLKMSILRWIND